MSTIREVSKSHSEQLLSKMSELRDSQTLIDVSLKVGGKSFKAHRVVLAASSEYFCAMFTDGMRESCAAEIELKDSSLTAEAFQVILDFVYKSELNVKEENVFEVLGAADHLQMTSVIEGCSTFISEALVDDQMKKMEIQSLQKVLNIAEKHSLADLKDEVFHKMAVVFKETCESEEFLEHIEASQLLSLLQRNDLTAPSETFVLEAVIRWIYHDKEERLGYAATLIQAVRLGLVDVGVLITELRREELKIDEDCRSILFEALLYDRKPSLLPELPLIKSSPRTTSSVLISFKEKAKLRFYSTTERKWQEFGEIVPINVKCRAVVSNGNYIYVGNMNTVHRYNIDSDTWDKLPTMRNDKWGRYQLLVLGDYLYAMSAEPERYSFREKAWQPIAAVSSTDLTAAILGGKIYAVASCRKITPSLLYFFDLSKNQWIRKLPTLSARLCGTVFVCNNKLILTGGKVQNGSCFTDINTVEVYDEASDSWSEVEQTHIAQKDTSFAFEAEGVIFFKLHNFAFDSGIRVSPEDPYVVNLDKWKTLAAFEKGSLITYAPFNVNKLLGDN